MIIRGGHVLTVDDARRRFVGDVRCRDGRIEALGESLDREPGEEELDASGCLVLPGFVQAHVHLCQTLFRGLADDMELLDWLSDRIWPMEAWHDAASMAASARLGLYELLRGGTTCILDMGSVHETDALFGCAEEAGIRYVGGKCLMDLDETGRVPDRLLEEPSQALADTERLIERWHQSADGRLRYAVAPRFAVSCSERLLRDSAELAFRHGVRLHTHASENRSECAAVKERTGRDNIDYLMDLGMLGSQTALAHCIHVSKEELNYLWGTGTHVVHCPSSNLKLASGIAPVHEMAELGINVALGADGAPCNNRLSMFREMHLAALLQQPRHGPKSMPAEKVLEMATIGGARAVGLEDEIGSIEVGKRADVIVLSLQDLDVATAGDPAAAVVYGAAPHHVRDVFVAGRWIVRDGRVLTLDGPRVLADARAAWDRLETSGIL